MLLSLWLSFVGINGIPILLKKVWFDAHVLAKICNARADALCLVANMHPLPYRFNRIDLRSHTLLLMLLLLIRILRMAKSSHRWEDDDDKAAEAAEDGGGHHGWISRCLSLVCRYHTHPQWYPQKPLQSPLVLNTKRYHLHHQQSFPLRHIDDVAPTKTKRYSNPTYPTLQSWPSKQQPHPAPWVYCKRQTPCGSKTKYDLSTGTRTHHQHPRYIPYNNSG
jgi:hypothetical protein